ncbi:type VII secretion system-associated protein [Streptomyces zhihengii]
MTSPRAHHAGHALVCGNLFPPPVAIGLMGAEDTVHGQTLLKSIMTAASSVAGILDTQQKLFANIDRNLGETVDTLLKNQGDTLESIGAEKMLDAFADTGRSAVTGQPTGSVGGVTLPRGPCKSLEPVRLLHRTPNTSESPNFLIKVEQRCHA